MAAAHTTASHPVITAVDLSRTWVEAANSGVFDRVEMPRRYSRPPRCVMAVTCISATQDEDLDDFEEDDDVEDRVAFAAPPQTPKRAVRPDHSVDPLPLEYVQPLDDSQDDTQHNFMTEPTSVSLFKPLGRRRWLLGG